MIGGLSQLALATAVRFGTGVFIFVFAARQWSPEQFGQFMYCFSIASLFVLCADLGFAQQVLKDVGANPARLSAKLCRFFAAKVWLTVVVLLGALGLSLLTHSSFPGQLILVMALVVAGCAGTFSELLFQTMRAVGRYGDEMRISLWTNGGAVVSFATVLTLGGTPITLALTFMVVRILQLGLVDRGCALAWFNLPRFVACTRPRRVINTIRHGQAYAYEVMVMAALTNVDTILVARIAGYSQAGIYQAAARLSQGVGIAFSVVAGYFLPKLANAQRSGEGSVRITSRLFIVAAGISVVLVIAFWLAAQYYNLQKPGSVMIQAVPILYGFAGLVMLRLFSGALAILLTAQGRQTLRATLYLCALAFFILSASVLVPVIGIWGALGAYFISYSILAIGFAYFSDTPLRLVVFGAAILLILSSAAVILFVYNKYAE